MQQQIHIYRHQYKSIVRERGRERERERESGQEGKGGRERERERERERFPRLLLQATYDFTSQ